MIKKSSVFLLILVIGILVFISCALQNGGGYSAT
jgi:hypothetical protein